MHQCISFSLITEGMNISGWRAAIARVLGLPTMLANAIGPRDEDARDSLAGQIAPPPVSQTRWYLSDLEDAIQAADVGDLSIAARLCRSLRRDGVLAGVLSTRTDGLVRLPIRWS